MILPLMLFLPSQHFSMPRNIPKREKIHFPFFPGKGNLFQHTLSDKTMSDKSDEIFRRWRKFCPTNNFVRRKFCPKNIFKTIEFSIFSDKSDEILAKWGKFCPTKNFVRRIFCPTLFCPIRYLTWSWYCFPGKSVKSQYMYGAIHKVRRIVLGQSTAEDTCLRPCELNPHGPLHSFFFIRNTFIRN